MAAFETTRQVPFGAITAYGLVQTVARTGERLRAWNNARVTRAALFRLTDRELDDVGLTRSDIERIARGGTL